MRIIIRFSTQKIGALLAYLACHLQRSHPREARIDLLWPEADSQAGRNSVSVALSSLRHQLDPPGVPAGSVLLTDRASVRRHPEAVTTAGYSPCWSKRGRCPRRWKWRAPMRWSKRLCEGALTEPLRSS